ncbi:ChaN family lipoprotein [Halomonas sp. McH1-25]|uniref:ChaN family lipoprotein n=1 Tax=unclassified Halomonas TaxID=2609666 RepID=UPI001EF74D50|nr:MULTISPECIES: ChaN family lipoprotein [unclassified Halomonas]MCG7599422.1 ChaN family lipoprotein [Halomonas sp. McH1-25]MCP1344273.1 ChaN family lipoprotein [Halomonas sp. FL8]MCP1362836.1 ChaN family lipoprotein [Halomonas sp. BBD45]MCP1366079.1 ChaN family lipoprotein [Halomonas sp. BBD48]
MQRRECLRALALLAMTAALPGLASARQNDALYRIRDLRRGTWLTGDALLAELARASAVIVGERHDNAEHHRLERWLIAQLAARGVLGGVVLEMLDPEQQRTLEGVPGVLLAELPEPELLALLDWQRDWDWAAYGPLVRQSLQLGVPLRAGNLTRETIHALVMANQVPSLPERVARAQRQAIVEGHCGLLPESMLDGMLAAQVARDRAMAAALAALPSTSVLVCGSAHARRDIGAALHAEPAPLCLGLVELAPGQDWLSALPDSVDDGPAFDIAWFTPPAVRHEDPCAALRQRFSS